MSISQLFPF